MLLIYIWITFPEHLLLFLGVSIIVVAFVAYAHYAAKEEEKRKAAGLVKHKGKWGTPEQVFEWKQIEKGLVKYQGRWITPEEKTRIEKEIEREREERELFESEQRRKGLVKFTDRFGQEHWDRPEEIKALRKKNFEEKQKAKGLVKYQDKWMTPKEAEFLRFKNEKSAEKLAEEIAVYIKEKAIGPLLGTRRFRKILQNFWGEKYSNVIRRAQIGWREWDSTVSSKVEEAQRIAPKKFFALLTEELIQWAQEKNLRRLTRADVKLFLMDNNINLSTSFEQMLYREAKLKYRYLPTWMRK